MNKILNKNNGIQEIGTSKCQTTGKSGINYKYKQNTETTHLSFNVTSEDIYMKDPFESRNKKKNKIKQDQIPYIQKKSVYTANRNL